MLPSQGRKWVLGNQRRNLVLQVFNSNSLLNTYDHTRHCLKCPAWEILVNHSMRKSGRGGVGVVLTSMPVNRMGHRGSEKWEFLPKSKSWFMVEQGFEPRPSEQVLDHCSMLPLGVSSIWRHLVLLDLPALTANCLLPHGESLSKYLMIGCC